MKVLRGPWREWEVEGRLALAVGVFDGVHVGHRAVLTAFRDAAEERSLVPGVVTFDRHPLTVLAPERAPKMLSTIDQRIEQFASLGAEVVAVLPFDDDMRTTSPEAFVSEILVDRLHAGLVVVGEDFRFGENRGGDVGTLEAMGPGLGFSVEVIDLVGDQNPVSSTRIRAALAAGDVGTAAEMLGRPYQLMGEVVEGAGRSLVTGAPTANLDVPTTVAIPRRGVYAVMAGTSELVPSVANVGVRPTFGEGVETIEVHILDEEAEPRGAELRIDFIDRIRDEAAFFDADALARQIDEDIVAARRILSQTP